jgi:uncharacterized protein
LRIVFDTSVYISAFVSAGKVSYRTLNLAAEGKIDLVTSHVILAELGNTLKEKLNVPKQTADCYINSIIDFADIVRPNFQFNILADRPDNRILECAVKGKADLIVTGDKQMLALKNFKGIGVCTPADLLHTIGEQSL